MKKSLSAAITTMLLITSSAWAASPEGQSIRPTGDNMPEKSPEEQADAQRDNRDEESRAGQRGERMKEEHRQERQEQREDRARKDERHDMKREKNKK
ncbi:hypothetical protein [Marinobacter sp.]|uniref:hypothetical protein n=1 Tax=Marinobacter sp. TaxID=50741 RepID=UPI00356ACCEC